MKTNPFLEYIIYDILDESLHITSQAMMGGYILYSEGKVFAIVDDDKLWFKGSDTLAPWYISKGSKKFRVSRSRGSAVNKSEGKKYWMNYFSVPESVIENKTELDEWLEQALSVSMLPKSKKKK